MKRTLLFLSISLGTFSFAQDCSELFISEYVEGWSNNKALEIYNPTNQAIDLSEYCVVRYSNGATSASTSNAIQLTGTIPAYGTHVGVLDKTDPNGSGQDAPVWDSLQARADAFYCPDYNVSTTWYWNGNDAIVLFKGTMSDAVSGLVQPVDVFGKIGENPGNGSDPLGGWTADFPYVQAGDGVTTDHSMIRKASILHGVTSNPSFFNPLAEYDSIPPVIDIGGQTYGNWSTLGEHTCDCAVGSVNEIQENLVSIYPNPTKSQFWIKGAENFSEITVINSLGKEVRVITGNTKSVISFNFEDRRGVYFVKLTDNQGNVVTKRVIVK